MWERVTPAPAATLRLHHPIPPEVIAETDLPQARGGHHRAEPRLILGVEQEEPAAAGANQFAAEGAVRPRQFIVVVALKVSQNCLPAVFHVF